MKKILRSMLLLLLFLPALQVMQAQIPLAIQGYVYNLNNQPIAGKVVYIHVDSVFGVFIPFTYSGTTTTNQFGYFIDTVLLPAGATTAMVTGYVLDCNNVPQHNYSWYNSPAGMAPMYFTICDSAVSTNCNASFAVGLMPNSLTVSFVDISVPSMGSQIVSWFWDFGDSTFSTFQQATHTYMQSGTYNVCLTITDGINCSSTFCQVVVVSTTGPGGCVAGFTATPAGGTTTVSFTDMSSPSIGSQIVSWFWEFGDSTTSTLQNATHTYAQPGTYNVCLTITDSINCSSTFCQMVVVSNTGPGGCVAGFIATPVGGTTTVTFTNTSGNLYMPAVYTEHFLWSFGDGITQITQNYNPVTHVYSQPGSYLACIAIYVTDIATNTVVCMDTFCTMVTAGSGPAQTGFLYGILTSNNNAAGPSEVYLIEHNTLLGILTAVDTTYSIDSAGMTTYYFAGITPGNYLIKAAMLPQNPNYASNMPTYHLSSLYWSQATMVNVLPNAITQASVNFIQGINPGGPGFIGGLISQGANKGPGDPIEGIEVLLLDALNGDQPIAVTYSDAAGMFGFSNLAYGTYKVYAEMINKTTIPVVVSIDAGNPSIDGIQVVVGSQVISFIQSPMAFTAENIGNIHPNPASGLCFLPVKLENPGLVNLEIIDLTGKVYHAEKQTLPAGPGMIRLDISSLSKGIYLVSITSKDGSRVTRKLVKNE